MDTFSKHFELDQVPLDDYRPLLPSERVTELRQQFSSESWTKKDSALRPIQIQNMLFGLI